MAVTAFASGQGIATASAAIVPPTPVVSFSSQPTVSPSTGAAGQTYTATPGAVNNGSVTSREWRLAGNVVSNALTFVSSVEGAGTYQEFADSVASNLIPFTVTAAAGTAWILATGSWDDNAPWDDTQLWKDAA